MVLLAIFTSLWSTGFVLLNILIACDNLKKLMKEILILQGSSCTIMN